MVEFTEIQNRFLRVAIYVPPTAIATVLTLRLAQGKDQLGFTIPLVLVFSILPILAYLQERGQGITAETRKRMVYAVGLRSGIAIANIIVKVSSQGFPAVFSSLWLPATAPVVVLAFPKLFIWPSKPV